jgi:hypothetical protein
MKMDKEDLREISNAIRDLRFIQAAAIVALGQKDYKATVAYMDKLAKLQQKVEQEMVK